MNNNKLTINIPFWLVLLAIVLLVARIFISVIETRQPEVEGIHWIAASKIDLSGRDYQPKLVLYNFTAKDNDSCTKLNNTSLLSKDVVNIVNEQYVPVQVENVEVLDATEASKINSELQQKFAVFIYPTLVVTLPSGKIVESHNAYVGPKSLFRLLERCLKKAKYIEGLDCLAHANYYQTTRYLEEWLRVMPGSQSESTRAALYCALSYNMLSNIESARNAVRNILKSSSNRESEDISVLLARFVTGDLSADELLKRTESNHNIDSRIYYFIAMRQLKEQNIQSAIQFFNLADKGVYNAPEVHDLIAGQLAILGKH